MPESDPSEKIQFDEKGLIPCVVQDWRTGEILTLAYMNDEALRLTRDTGWVHFWSRSRQELWRKGETSGNTLEVQQIRYDCDADAMVALVNPKGPACHTGERSCFYRELSSDETPDPALHETLEDLGRLLSERARERPEGSYTVELLDDPELIGAKVEEEAEEVARAAREEADLRVANEAADLIYHLMVLMESRGVGLDDVYGVLRERRG